MIFRIFSLSITQIVLCSTLLTSSASAQTQPPINIFFGFDFVLHPIAIKWACGGPTEQDLHQLEVLMIAFPEDAERAELRSNVEMFLGASEQEAGLFKLLGGALSSQQRERLCTAALPLKLDWLTPEQLIHDDKGRVSSEHIAKWEAFSEVIEELQ